MPRTRGTGRCCRGSSCCSNRHSSSDGCSSTSPTCITSKLCGSQCRCRCSGEEEVGNSGEGKKGNTLAAHPEPGGPDIAKARGGECKRPPRAQRCRARRLRHCKREVVSVRGHAAQRYAVCYLWAYGRRCVQCRRYSNGSECIIRCPRSRTPKGQGLCARTRRVSEVFVVSEVSCALAVAGPRPTGRSHVT